MTGDDGSGLGGGARVVGDVGRCWRYGLCGLVAMERCRRHGVAEERRGGSGRTSKVSGRGRY